MVTATRIGNNQAHLHRKLLYTRQHKKMTTTSIPSLKVKNWPAGLQGRKVAHQETGAEAKLQEDLLHVGDYWKRQRGQRLDGKKAQTAQRKCGGSKVQKCSEDYSGEGTLVMVSERRRAREAREARDARYCCDE